MDRLPHEGAKVTPGRQYTEKRVKLYAITRLDLPEYPVVVEEGAPRWMARYAAADENVEHNWYGLLESDARFVPLSLKVEHTPGKSTYTWTFMEAVFPHGADLTHHYSPGDIFASYILENVENHADYTTSGSEQANLKFGELVQMPLPVLRAYCRDLDILYYNGQTRTQLAMMLNAPVPQDEQCSSCGITITGRHAPTCEIALCLASGRRRISCDGKHVGYCGNSKWNGYDPGVLESFVYDVTPETILAKGGWDKSELMFVYAPDGEEPVRETDETYVEPDQNVEQDPAKNFSGMLAALGDKAKQEAARDDMIKATIEEIGLNDGQGAGEASGDGGQTHRRHLPNRLPGTW